MCVCVSVCVCLHVLYARTSGVMPYSTTESCDDTAWTHAPLAVLHVLTSGVMPSDFSKGLYSSPALIDWSLVTCASLTAMTYTQTSTHTHTQTHTLGDLS